MNSRVVLLFYAIIWLTNIGCDNSEVEKAPDLPLLIIANITHIEPTLATVQSITINDGGAEITSRGICFSKNPAPSTSDAKTHDGAGIGYFTSLIEGLEPGNSYYVRAYAINSAGTSYSEPERFETPPITAPIISTLPIESINFPTALSGGNVISDGNSPVTSRGICWSTDINPTIEDSKTHDGNGEGSFTSTMTDLHTSFRYYARAYATNSIGTSYGEEIVFSGVVDADGNYYTTVEIGTQVWLKENLKTTKYNNGEQIEFVANQSADNTKWGALQTGAWSAYNNNSASVSGNLYNWYAVVDTRGVCPVNSHIPSEAEWTTLIDYLGGSSVAGGALKEAGREHWINNDLGATNSSGFTSLPGGFRSATGFHGLYTNGVYWTSKDWTRTRGLSYQTINSRIDVIGAQSEKFMGYSVRCIKD